MVFQLPFLFKLDMEQAPGVMSLGRDYINPALRPVFDRIAASVWKEVTA
jgi:hypothetical protein